jgi:hypothetical protein
LDESVVGVYIRLPRCVVKKPETGVVDGGVNYPTVSHRAVPLDDHLIVYLFVRAKHGWTYFLKIAFQRSWSSGIAVAVLSRYHWLDYDCWNDKGINVYSNFGG